MDAKYGFAQTEKLMQQLWRQHNTYSYSPAMPGEKLFSVDTPPPTVSGSLHIGHVFSYAQGEMVARFHRMQGEKVFYPFGFDDNGLPTERLVERETGKRARDMEPRDFSRICGETARHYEKEFMDLWDSLGFSIDWSLCYRTGSEEVARLSQQMFLELAEKGKAYQKESPVLWCTECGTSIAQAELESAQRDGMYHYINFPTEKGPIPVATTRPELLYACVCLFVHPEDRRYKMFEGAKATVPIYGHEIPVIFEDTVDMEKGTGAVMCSSFGDSTDVQWCEKHKLPYRKAILPDGTMDARVPQLGGMRIKAARRHIAALLEEQGLLIKTEPTRHMVAIHERCGKEVEILPSRQWYIALLGEKERLLKAGEEIRWNPPHMQNRYRLWVENLKWDWCISRQRFHGVPFPLWHCKACGKPIFASKEDLPVDPRHSSPSIACSCGCREAVPETAVMDTWATSSITPFINGLRRDGLWPMTVRFQAHEIIRTWTFYSIARGLLHRGQIPWKELMISGFVLAKPGEKISKSKENSTMEPKKLIESYSADALRYWSAGAKLGTDTFFAPEELKLATRFMTKLWNAAKFAQARLQDYKPKKCSLLPQDIWILQRLNQVYINAAKAMNSYEVGLARQEIDEFFWKDLCDDYMELAKERLYQPEKHGENATESGKYTLYNCILGVLKLYAPFVPHITEAIYQQCFREKKGPYSVHLSLWEKPHELKEEFLEFGAEIKKLLMEVRRYKSENRLSMKEAIPCLEINCLPRQREWFSLAEMDLLACTHAERIKIDII